MTARARAMQEAYIGVQPHSGQRGSAVAGQHGVGKGKQRIDVVQWRTAAAHSKGEVLALLQNQRIEAVKVALGGFALQPQQLPGILAGFNQWQGYGQLRGGTL